MRIQQFGGRLRLGSVHVEQRKIGLKFNKAVQYLQVRFSGLKALQLDIKFKTGSATLRVKVDHNIQHIKQL